MARLLRLTGVAGVAVLWATVGLGMWRTGLGLAERRTISYLGTDPRSASLFRAGLIIATLLLVAFAWEVNRGFPRRTGFFALFLVGMAGQAVVASVSLAGDGASHAVHTTAGIILGLSLPLLMWRFAAGQTPGPWRRRSYAVMWLSVVATVAGIALSRARLAGIAEVVPAVAFHLWIVVVTLGWPRWHHPAGRREARLAGRRVTAGAPVEGPTNSLPQRSSR